MMNSFMKRFGLTVPIVQAPIGSCATVALVTAVGRAGGMGSLAMTWTDEKAGTESIATLVGAGVPFFFNNVLRFGSVAVDRFLRPGIPALTLSWGLDPAIIGRAHALGVAVGVQASSATGARQALAAGADFLVAQGMEAGGHVQSTTPLAELLPQVVRVAGDVPVIAAGGIATPEGIAAALRAGAQAVAMGTRFLATAEANAHDLYKQVLVKASAADWAFTNCFDIDWPYAMHGVLRNSTFEMWEAAGSPAAPHRPGEGDIIAHNGEKPIVRYADAPPFRNATGDVLATCLYAGKGVGAITDIAPAGDIVTRLWKEAAALV